MIPKKGGTIIAGYYNRDKDYSEAIANETDPGKREALLAERQNKIDAEGMADKVASNQSVSTWNGNYRPYSVTSGLTAGGGTATSPDVLKLDVAGLYDAMERNRLAAFESARNQNWANLQRQYETIDGQYRDNMSQTQVNSRLSAMGSEEKLAALGLNAGGRYDAPTSGYTETSRVSMDNAMRNSLNGLGVERSRARSYAQSAADSADSALLTQNATQANQAALQLAQAVMSQYNADRSYGLQSAAMTGYLNGQPTLDTRQYWGSLASDTAQREAQAQQKQQAAQQAAAQTNYENALTRWKTYGYVLPADADVLGVPSGTPTSDERYSQAELELSKIKTNYQVSK